MAENKKSIVVYADWIEKFEELEDVEAGRLIKHFFRYVNDLDPIAPDRITKLSFISIKQALKRDLEKWEKTKEGRSKAGKASAEKRRVSKLNEQLATNPTNVESVEKNSTNPTVSVNDNVNVNVNDSANEIKTIINNSNFSKICYKDNQWLEVVAMQKRIKIDVIKLFMTTFEEHLITMQEQKTDLKKFKSHFVYWLDKQDLSQFRVKKIGKTNQV